MARSDMKLPERVIFVLLLTTFHLSAAVLEVGFYNKTCPQAESIVQAVVQERFGLDKSVPAALLRMLFHDCFVRGCDASILIDSTSDNPSEKESGPNQTVREFDLIDEAKKRLEAACPSTVSCADIIILATRDSVALAGGPGYAVPTGRRDGLISNVDDVNVPDPSFTVSESLQAFSAKGFNLTEMVVLLGGGHSIGFSHCSFFQDRILDFQGTGSPDPTMNKTLVSKLQKVCGAASESNNDPTTFLDQATPFHLDNQFYSDILSKNGILKIDQELAMDKSSAGIVSKLAVDVSGFRQSFANAMVKLSGVQVLVGNAGEIRKNCRAFNPKSTTSPPASPPPKNNAPAPPPQKSNAPGAPPPPMKNAPATPPPKNNAPASPPTSKNAPAPSPHKSNAPGTPPPMKNAPATPPQKKKKSPPAAKNNANKNDNKKKKKNGKHHHGRRHHHSNRQAILF